MSENWFSPTAAGNETGPQSSIINDFIKASYRDILTAKRVVSLIVFVNPPLVFSEYLESLVELLPAVHFVVLYRKRLLLIFVVIKN